jgi:hypothetical protein
MVDLAGNHGHLMFRPHMTEDWIIWSITFISFIAGLLFLIKAIKRKVILNESTHNSQNNNETPSYFGRHKQHKHS